MANSISDALIISTTSTSNSESNQPSILICLVPVAMSWPGSGWALMMIYRLLSVMNQNEEYGAWNGPSWILVAWK
jgi:hypothetical protein